MGSKNVREFTTDNWDQEVLQSDQPVLVDFWAPWCGPCRQLGPTIERLAEKYAGRVKVGKLNTDDHQDLAVRYGISGIPQVLLFHGGDQPRERLVGLQAENTLAKMIDRVLQA
jgi:thioredoxin 1